MEQGFTKRAAAKKGRGRKGLAGIGELVPKLVRSLKLQSQFDEYNIQRLYGGIFGAGIRKVSFPDRLIKKTLYIKVANSPWLMQLSFIKAEIIEKINAALDKNVVKDVVFKVGAVTKHGRTSRSADSISLKNISLDEKTIIKIIDSVSGLKDKELKKAVVAAQTAYYKRRQKSTQL